MSGGDLQYAVTGAVIDGQFHFDARYGHVSHDAGTGYVERVFVCLPLFVGKVPAVAVRRERLVVGVRRVEHVLFFFAGEIFGLFHVACHGVRLVHAVPPVAECWVCDEADRADHEYCGYCD